MLPECSSRDLRGVRSGPAPDMCAVEVEGEVARTNHLQPRH